MAKFCKYCGKPIENEVCDCEKARAARQAAESQPVSAAVPTPGPVVTPPPTPVVTPPPAPSPEQVNYQQTNAQQTTYQQTYAQQQPSPQVEAAKQYANESKFLFMNLLKKPIAGIQDVNRANNDTPALIIGVVHLLIIFIGCAILINSAVDNIPYASTVITGSVKTKMSLLIMIVAAIPILVFTLVGWISGKKNNPTLSFVHTLAVFFSATAIGSILLLAALICSFLFSGVGLFLILVCVISWIYASSEAMSLIVNAARDKWFWSVMLSCVLSLVAISLVIYGVADKMVNQLSSLFGSLF